MRTIPEIKKELKSLRDEIVNLNATDAAFEEKSARADELMRELEKAEKLEQIEQAAAERKLSELQKAAGRKFSITKFLRDIIEHREPQGLEGEVAKIGADELKRSGQTPRGFVIPTAFLRATGQGAASSTPSDGNVLITESSPRYVESLKDRLVCAKLGATILGDLTGVVPVFTNDTVSASWLAEAAAASVSKIAFEKKTMSPHRASIVGAFSKDLIYQTSVDVENVVTNELINAHAKLIEQAVINGSGSNGQPTGILNTTGIGAVTSGGTLSWANVVALESTVASANALQGNLGYLTNGAVMGDLKTISKSASNPTFLLDAPYNNLNGYKFEWTNLVPADTIVFGNWADLFIGQWGGLDIVVDNYTLAHQAEIRIVINTYNDVCVARAESFAAITDL